MVKTSCGCLYFLPDQEAEEAGLTCSESERRTQLEFQENNGGLEELLLGMGGGAEKGVALGTPNTREWGVSITHCDQWSSHLYFSSHEWEQHLSLATACEYCIKYPRGTLKFENQQALFLVIFFLISKSVI